jgi:hypothetical protein
VATGIDWSTVRGAFVVSGRLSTGHADGTMTARGFDGTTAGPATPPRPQRPDQHPAPRQPHHRHVLLERPLYYTLSADPRLYYRWFTPQRGTLGADTFVASGTTNVRNRSTVNGMTMGSSRLIYATTTGTLTTVDFPGRPPHRPRHGGERRRRRRPLLAVPGLTGFRYPAPHHAPVAQGTEQLSPKQQVAGSSPARGTRNCRSQAIRSLLCLLCGHSLVILLR